MQQVSIGEKQKAGTYWFGESLQAQPADPIRKNTIAERFYIWSCLRM